ncbi:nucleotide-binding universal stress UspA family protein [Corynebacterium guangdongense]|uniref:Nucleotide-binding universal stress UspA family protein n=2 Tax=Corynebacterium guangdongense TaxID=1783348 RepID=A0ABU1ZZS6_9CORY|nr:nucleotide-binding universal stress UspA family protein [Corynebacterium guangdongense]
MTRMLIAYDGSPEARHALTEAARLLRPVDIEILTAWEPVTSQATRALGRTGLPQTTIGAENVGADPAYEDALALSEEGIALARSLGLTARAHLVESTGHTATAISEAAVQLGADVIVAGTRARSGPHTWFTTSTSEGILRKAGIPVFIVPPRASGGDGED